LEHDRETTIGERRHIRGAVVGSGVTNDDRDVIAERVAVEIELAETDIAARNALIGEGHDKGGIIEGCNAGIGLLVCNGRVDHKFVCDRGAGAVDHAPAQVQ
jgi:hypothetical protein